MYERAVLNVDVFDSGPVITWQRIDVFICHLVDELKELWSEGIMVRDACNCNNFKLRAALLWTINDFLARSTLSGWSGQDYKACPTYNVDTPSVRSRSKTVYVGHRRWLLINLPYCRSKNFNGKLEKATVPWTMTTPEILK